MRGAQGQAEPRAGDAVLATFDSVAAAVETALLILRRTAKEDFNGVHLDVHMGAHFGDVLRRDEAVFGDAINVAERLQGLALPSTLCISSSVYRQVRHSLGERVVDLGRRRLKNISYRVHAYLVAPQDVALPFVRRSRRLRLGWILAAGSVALVAVAGTVLTHYFADAVPFRRVSSNTRVPDQPTVVPVVPVVLGVMLFKCHGLASEDQWMCEALRDGFNMQLSKLERVKVFSKEFLDFLTSRKGMPEIEVAKDLGITKMLFGSLVAIDDTITIEVHVVDVETGTLERPPPPAEGPKKAFFDLVGKMVLQVVAQMNLPLMDEERDALVAQRNTDMEAFKRLLDAEGIRVGPRAEPEPPPPALEPRSSVEGPRDWFAWLAPSAAGAAEDTLDERRGIIDALDRYRRAVEERDMQALAGVYAEFTPEQRDAQERYFANVRDLKITIDDVDIAVVRDEAAVSYTRTDDFVDVRTGRPIHVSVRTTKILRLENGEWKLVAGK